MVSIRIAQQHLPIYNDRPTAQSLSIAALYFGGASARHGYRRWPDAICEIDHRRTPYRLNTQQNSGFAQSDYPPTQSVPASRTCQHHVAPNFLLLGLTLLESKQIPCR